MESEEKYFIINAMGQDRAGLIAMLSKVIANAGYNIIDIEQSAPHGIFSIIMVIEPTSKAVSNPLSYFNIRFEEISAGTQLSISINDFKGGIRKELKIWNRVIFVGPDKSGIIATLSDFAGKHKVNIHRMNMISRGEIIACEILLDISSVIRHKEKFIEELKVLGDSLGLQIIIEEENIYKKKRKLLVIDLDKNPINVSGLHNFIQSLDFSNSMEENTSDTMDSLRNNTELAIEKLNGLEIETVMSILSAMRVSPGTEELMRAFRLMNYKIAIISSSLNLFLDSLKQKLHLDYAFGNCLEIENNKLTGKYISGLNLNVNKKNSIISWLATMEKIPEAEILQFGLDAKDTLSLHSIDLGLSITFDYDMLHYLLRKKQFTEQQLLVIFKVIGIENSLVEAIKNRKNSNKIE